MFLPEEIMRRKVVTSIKVAMNTAADFDLVICKYIQIKRGQGQISS